MERMKVEKKEVEGNIFYFSKIGEEEHGKPSFLLWINKNVPLKQDECGIFIEFPIKNSKIRITEKGNFVLYPSIGWTVFKVGVPCGYRGTSTFEVLEPKIEIEVLPFKCFSSQLGNLGISSYALISTKSSNVKIRWERSGRTYGDPICGITIYYDNGKEEILEGILDGLEAIKELKEELNEIKEEK